MFSPAEHRNFRHRIEDYRISEDAASIVEGSNEPDKPILLSFFFFFFLFLTSRDARVARSFLQLSVSTVS